MALSTNYRRNQGREDRAIENRLAKAQALSHELGCSLQAASAVVLGRITIDEAMRRESGHLIEVAVDAGIPSCDWLRVATKIARAAAEAHGVEWIDADIFVSLPEPGRCFTKSPGRTALCANG